MAANAVCVLQSCRDSGIGTQEAVKSKYLQGVEVEVGIKGRELLFVLSCLVLSEKSLRYFVYIMKDDFKANFKSFSKGNFVILTDLRLVSMIF